MAYKRSLALLSIIFMAVAVPGCLDAAKSPPSSANATLVAITVAPPTAPAPTPGPTPAPTAVREASQTNGEWYDRTYSWEYKNVQWSFQARISKPIYEFYKNSPHGDSNYAKYASTGQDRDFFRDMAEKLKDNGASNGYSGDENAMNALVFVQSLPYKEDTVEYTRYPIETLVDDEGDCKDKAILAAAILHEMGYDTVLLEFPQHVALGVKMSPGQPGTYYEYGGSRYYYAEATSANWSIGDVPDGIKGQSPEIYPVV